MAEAILEGYGGGGGWGQVPSKGLEAFLQRDWQNVQVRHASSDRQAVHLTDTEPKLNEHTALRRQEAVKASFFFMAAVLQEHNREISALKQQLEERPTRQQVEALMARYQTKEKADDQLLSLRTALAEKPDRAEVVLSRGSASSARDLEDMTRGVHALRSAVEELQAKAKDSAVAVEQVRAEVKRRGVVLDELAEHAARKVSPAGGGEGGREVDVGGWVGGALLV